MHGLPAGFDASRFVGRHLELVSFTTNTIHFSFSEFVSITIESSFEHRARDGEVDRGSVPVSESRLMQLLGETIEHAQASTDGTLVLGFGDGQTLTCFDDMPMYEAYRFKIGDEETFV